MCPRQLPWEPAIYEHKAALIGKSPAETASSAPLLVRALLAEHAVYGADFLTVGLDVYNVEAEACGAVIPPAGPRDCPEIVTPLFDPARLPRELDLPDTTTAGRFPLLIEAALRTRARLGNGPVIQVAAAGPASIAARLAGTEPLLLSLALGDDGGKRLLHFAGTLAGHWLGTIRRAGLAAIVFDSAAAPPLFSPVLYEATVFPWHRRLMAQLRESGQEHRPLVIGGRTAAIAHRLAQTGATRLVCDFNETAEAFAAGLAEAAGSISVRRNISPAALEDTSRDTAALAAAYHRQLACFQRPFGGTGVLPYGFAPGRFLDFRRAVTALARRQVFPGDRRE